MGSLRQWQCCVNGTVGVLLLLSPWVALFQGAGLWLVVAPWILGFAGVGPGAWAAWASAGALLVLSGGELVMPGSLTAPVLLGLVGICLLVMPWVRPVAPGTATAFCEFVPGLVVTFASAWALTSIQDARRSGRPTRPSRAQA